MALVIPSLAGLFASASRGLFKIFAGAWSDLGFSANAIIGAFRSAGGEIRRTDALKMIRSATDQMKYQKQILAAPEEGPLNRKWVTETDRELKGNYQIFANAIYRDKATGGEIPTKISFFQDENVGKLDWGANFVDGFGKFEYEKFYNVVSLTVTGAIHQIGKPY